MVDSLIIDASISYGQIGIGGSTKLVYSAAYLFDATSVSSDNRAILRVEYEFF